MKKTRQRRMKKLRLMERLSESAFALVRLLLLWSLVLLVDFLLDFRLEYLWPCCLFFCSVYSTFHCHGPVLCMAFVCAAFTLDIFCLLFVPLHWLFFVASTYVLFNYIWHTDCRWKGRPDGAQYLCMDSSLEPSDSVHVLDCLQIRTEEHEEEADSRGSTCLSSLSKVTEVSEQGPSLPKDEQGAKALKAPKNSSPEARRNSRPTPSPPGGRADKKHRANPKSISPSRDTAHSAHADHMNRLEQDVRRLKAELQNSRQEEQELKSHMCNLNNSESSLRPELELLQDNNMLLHTKLLCLGRIKLRDKQTCALLERKSRAEAEARLCVERQLSDLQQLKSDERAAGVGGTGGAARSLSSTQELDLKLLRTRLTELELEHQDLQQEAHLTDARLKRLQVEMECLGHLRPLKHDSDLLLSSLSSFQDKAQQLELSLSAETRIKLDLFSAVGDTRRRLQIAQDKLFRQEREVAEMKHRVAEVIALSPTPRPAPHPDVPPYLNKLLSSEHYGLNPRYTLVYHCLKK